MMCSLIFLLPQILLIEIFYQHYCYHHGKYALYSSDSSLHVVKGALVVWSRHLSSTSQVPHSFPHGKEFLD
jgi:hypothetical protein